MAVSHRAEYERFDAKDIVQSAVGSLAGALIYAYQTDIARIADSLPDLNTAIIVLITLALSFFIGYRIGVRKLGKRKMRLLLGLIPIRTIVHYVLAFAFSAAMLWLLGINSAKTQLDVMLRRIIVLSLPATVPGSAIDLIESQKE